MVATKPPFRHLDGVSQHKSVVDFDVALLDRFINLRFNLEQHFAGFGGFNFFQKAIEFTASRNEDGEVDWNQQEGNHQFFKDNFTHH